MCAHCDRNRSARLVRLGPRRLWDFIARQYTTRLHLYLQRRMVQDADVQDTLQDVLLKAGRVVRSWDPARCLEKWLFRVARNCLIDRTRRTGTALRCERFGHAALDGDDENIVDLIADPTAFVVDRIYGKELRDVLDEYRMTLPSEHRPLFVLWLETRKCPDGANSTVRMRLRRMLIPLRDYLALRGFDPAAI